MCSEQLDTLHGHKHRKTRPEAKTLILCRRRQHAQVHLALPAQHHWLLHTSGLHLFLLALRNLLLWQHRSQHHLPAQCMTVARQAGRAAPFSRTRRGDERWALAESADRAQAGISATCWRCHAQVKRGAAKEGSVMPAPPVHMSLEALQVRFMPACAGT